MEMLEQIEFNQDNENEEGINPIDEILKYVANTPHNTNPNILRQMLIALYNKEPEVASLPIGDDAPKA